MSDKETNKKNKTFTADFWVYLLIFIVLIGIICYFPVLFTESGKFLYILCNIFKISTIQNPYCF